jgi:hypothetical protein
MATLGRIAPTSASARVTSTDLVAPRWRQSRGTRGVQGHRPGLPRGAWPARVLGLLARAARAAERRVRRPEPEGAGSREAGRGGKTQLTKTMVGPWKPAKVLTYTANVYRVAGDDECPGDDHPEPVRPILRQLRATGWPDHARWRDGVGVLDRQGGVVGVSWLGGAVPSRLPYRSTKQAHSKIAFAVAQAQ